MRLRFLGIALGILLVHVPAVASADTHRWGFYGAGSYGKASNLFGFQMAGDVAIGEFMTTQGWHKTLTAIGDFSIHAGEHNGADVRVKAFQGGAGFRKAASANSKHVFGGHALYGKTLGDAGRFAQTYGGSYEFAPHRVENGFDTAFRVQYDVVVPNGADNNYQRFSFGGVIRYNKRPAGTGGTGTSK
jgi:hypothetical protein